MQIIREGTWPGTGDCCRRLGTCETVGKVWTAKHAKRAWKRLGFGPPFAATCSLETSGWMKRSATHTPYTKKMPVRVSPTLTRKPDTAFIHKYRCGSRPFNGSVIHFEQHLN